ncbi:bifunctional diaminohydroxyphosphoribosylaminopyrimidine deaminase/5-amino-6-(5-phosphoribosylamino)uracil reductase RibD [Hahella aquimaris]|uniref:bifunctional diaminohydroxyphosphoribosylaminopyrimidine deaminase/5-amino-6-(5-phosphoribosylamino)uracil reductase RibD n=1 Tax=Hahella sp. HNIBRBA332 TaxID=3015983 RepID=UPI00273BF7DD|nr:bifunctional diaminohydroxyphosphoribosylaminopyrimidine deaminase/5-amino-6-(5-phosphoribosylamino)uracil reductase RibD [Hahella sp. HNIBRBA332]WLQ15507.1 bifunctional diaminohydroxyphosphoribosylaminopyrimidine deaminase/5-amino-6-(5-phosphoribosylamino)uracil reductase RibD [Hahella sp. HNIBRBA332]
MQTRELERFMRLAIAEGRKAIAHCRPNPPVGCVLVRNGQVVASGHTNAPGQPHAEAMALHYLHGPTADTIAFVTLEPCSFHGRTPSCAQTLVKLGIRKLYVGMLDPHPKNRGAGIDILKQAGAEVVVGILENEVRKELEAYLWRPDNGERL